MSRTFPTLATKKIENTVRLVMAGSYFGWARPKKEHEEKLVARLLEALERSGASRSKEEKSATVDEIRQMLMRNADDNRMSAITTCNLFFALGRSDELSSIVMQEADSYTSDDYTTFVRRLTAIGLWEDGEF